MEFDKEVLEDLAQDFDDDRFEIMETVLVDSNHDEHDYRQIFKFDGKYYQTEFTNGTCKHSGVSPYSCDSDMIECQEMIQESITTVKYVKKETQTDGVENTEPQNKNEIIIPVKFDKAENMYRALVYIAGPEGYGYVDSPEDIASVIREQLHESPEVEEVIINDNQYAKDDEEN